MQAQTTRRKDAADVLPPTPRRRQKGDPKEEIITFRPPKRLAAYLAEMKRLNYNRTAALLDLAEPMLEVKQALGPEWWDLAKAADVAGETVGATIARLVRAGLKRK